MTVLTFDDVKYAKAEAEARRRGVDLRAKLSHEVDAYAYDADVRESDSADGDEIVGVWRTHDDIREFFDNVLREAGADV
ncbi:MAG: hypothetical protein LKI34_01000 [Bifidobacterium tibiigranuli]|jgi:hypothetical protein|uniref:hypothetical protein n=1 Tax=Bifidobacterium tibiigranuli TaxID=2172043 RepID=UPI0026EFED70|nr:hypothetical protein [Bifidobacterium tibiigranuli]MCI1672788.1 hypothetical protein [Bifidobacterium tibiigranuli]MCI1712207.1 hypothetical protein [Bifidobacterium tibiigranuli]